MTRTAASAVSIVALGGASALLGGEPGLVGGALGLAALVTGLLLGSPWFVNAGAVIVGGTYLVRLVLFGGAVDPRAPLLAVTLFASLEAGHLALDCERYDLPGGMNRLLRRLAYLAGIAALGYVTGWGVLLTGLPLLVPALAGTAAGAVAVVTVMVVLRVLRPSADLDADRPAA